MKPWKYERGDMIATAEHGTRFRILRRLSDVDTDVRLYIIQPIDDNCELLRNAKAIESPIYVKQ